MKPSNVLLLPGWQNSGPQHWQTLWEQRHGYHRVEQSDWDRPLRGDEAETFGAGGLMLESETKPLLPAVMETLSPTLALLTLTEGRYHQVRRMFAAMGNHVTALHRESLGGLALPDDLEPGAWRVLDEAGIATIFA